MSETDEAKIARLDERSITLEKRIGRLEILAGAVMVAACGVVFEIVWKAVQ